MGETRAERRLFRDTTHAIGVREYVHGDDLKSIHWKATARRSDLQVKLLDATTAFNVAMVLAVEGFRDNGVLDCLQTASRAMAVCRGRDFVIPDDVKSLAVPVLSHRIILKTEARLKGRTEEDLLGEALDSVPVPAEG